MNLQLNQTHPKDPASLIKENPIAHRNSPPRQINCGTNFFKQRKKLPFY
jgi:hypothetical protein